MTDAARSPVDPGLRRRIEELGPWFQNLILNCVSTAPAHFLGDYPAVKWRSFAAALPEDLSGRTVLDIGCNAGFHSFEMRRRGAERIVAIDEDGRYLAQARFAAEVLGIGGIEFRQMSVYDVERLAERFDLVLFLGVIYHLRHPLLALDLLHAHVTRDLLVYQSLQRGSGSADKSPLAEHPFEETALFDRPDFPRLHFVEHEYASDWTNWWVPNAACSAAMLRSAGFCIEANPESEVFICRRLGDHDGWGPLPSLPAAGREEA